MSSNKRPVGILLTLSAIALSALVLVTAAAPAAARHGCPHFESQADAQDYFISLGGSPDDRVGKLDPDGDGVACEGLDGPYAGYASVGYNHRKDFFYGYASMPQAGSPGEADEFPCMIGNRHFSDGPRRVNVFRVQPGPDKRIFSRNGLGAEARAETGRLVWKGERKTILPGRYYAEFEEVIRQHPYGENECPSFRSRSVALP